jgi:hypothetical protein
MSRSSYLAQNGVYEFLINYDMLANKFSDPSEDLESGEMQE